MDFNEYQKEAMTTQLPSTKNMNYLTLGLTGEAGEIANKAKKIIRDGKEITDEDLASELGDCLWYIAGLADLRGIPLSVIAEKNIEKLRGRKERGTIGGSGDIR